MSTDDVQLRKWVISGPSQSGKTQLMRVLTKQAFNDKHVSTIGVDFGITQVEHRGVQFKLQIWDTASQERFRFRTISTSYYRRLHAFILVFDLTNSEGLIQVEQFYIEGIKYFADRIDTVPIVLVGNKVDLTAERVISGGAAHEFASSRNMLYVEISCKDGDGIQELVTSVLDFDPMTPTFNAADQHIDVDTESKDDRHIDVDTQSKDSPNDKNDKNDKNCSIM